MNIFLISFIYPGSVSVHNSNEQRRFVKIPLPNIMFIARCIRLKKI